MISKHRNKFANTVFLNHLRKHPKPGVQNLALKVQKELTKQKELFQLEGNIPSVEEVFKHYVTHRKSGVRQLALDLHNGSDEVFKHYVTHQKSGVRQLALESQKGLGINLPIPSS